jgi:hypothetical protein
VSRCLGLSRVAALLCVLGCSHDGFLVPSTGPERSELVVAGSVTYVSGTLVDGLCDAGIAVVAKRDGRNERLVGITKSGKVFCVHLRPETAASSKSTVVSVEWGQDPDEQFWRTFTRLLGSMRETLATHREDASLPP